MPRKVDRDNPRDYNDLPENYLLCRDMYHHWAAYDVEVDKKAKLVVRIRRCSRCKTKRRDTMTMEGYMIGSARYDYSEAQGYQLKGHGRVTVDDRARLRVMNVFGRPK